MTKKLPAYPASVKKTLNKQGKWLWREDLAERVPPHLLVHYALACNALAEYRAAQDMTAELEKREPGSSLIAEKNGNIGIHPIRTLADRARRAFDSEMKLAGLTVTADDATADASGGDLLEEDE